MLPVNDNGMYNLTLLKKNLDIEKKFWMFKTFLKLSKKVEIMKERNYEEI